MQYFLKVFSVLFRAMDLNQNSFGRCLLVVCQQQRLMKHSKSSTLSGVS